MKLVFKTIGYLLLFAVTYLLYQSQLGAIPFLLISIVLFYLASRRTSSQADKERNHTKDHHPKENS